MKKLIVGILISIALLIAGAGLGYISSNYEFVNKEDIKQEEVNTNSIKEEELQTKPAELNTNTTTYTNQPVQQPVQTTPLTIEDVKVFDADPYDGTLEVTYTVTNNTNNHINRIDFHIYCTDSNGNKLTDTSVQVNVDLDPNTSNDILSKDVLLPEANNYSYVVVEATDFRF